MASRSSRSGGTGTSPRARGGRATVSDGVLPTRYIPARAGRPPEDESNAATGPVHPRGRGG